MTILILDDEELARELLMDYCKKVSPTAATINVKDIARAKDVLQKRKIDLLLLDINLGNANGLDFLREIEAPPMVILITAYKEYALEGYELNVVDYLLKPISFERFQIAFQKVQSEIKKINALAALIHPQDFQKEFIIVKDGYKSIKLFMIDIIRITAMREYVVYHTPDGKHMELKTITQVAEDLPKEKFIRVHRSHIVAAHQVKALSFKKIILHNDVNIPVGKTYWNTVKKLFS